MVLKVVLTLVLGWDSKLVAGFHGSARRHNCPDSFSLDDPSPKNPIFFRGMMHFLNYLISFIFLCIPCAFWH